MGHGIDFAEELAVNHRRLREAAAAAPSHSGRLRGGLRRHTQLLRRHVLPALSANVRGGARIAAADEEVLGRIEREAGEALAAPDDPVPETDRSRARRLAALRGLIETQLDWEVRVLVPLLEAETTWVVLEDLADHARLARPPVTCEPA